MLVVQQVAINNHFRAGGLDARDAKCLLEAAVGIVIEPYTVKFAAIKSAARSIPGVNDARPSMSSAANVWTIRDTSLMSAISWRGAFRLAHPKRKNKAVSR